MDEVTALLTAIGGLLGVLVWPALLLFLALRFRAPLGRFVGDLGELNLKAPGFEATARRQQVEAAAALGAAEAQQSGQAPGAVVSASDVADAVAEAVPNARAQRRVQGSSVLWVDDRPDNNRYERRALEALGVQVTLSTSTDDALEQIRRRSFDLIISDMGRPPDAQAGYTLLDKLRGDGNRTPYVIYAGSKTPEHVEQGRRRGATGVTNSPQELIRIVSQALGAVRG